MDEFFEQGAHELDLREPGRRRSKTRRPLRLNKMEQEEMDSLGPLLEKHRPGSRVECRQNEIRPCPFVGCRYNLFLDINAKNGNIKYNFPGKSPWEIPPGESCALDIAEREGTTLEEVGRMMNLTRERVRQVEVAGLEKLKSGCTTDLDIAPPCQEGGER